ncbi:MAG TPA: ankyrin repeat domain-containing protein [Bryobacteraceae bacterium]|jgi:ankyrin repeat protein
MALLNEIADGRTDLVFEFLAEGNSATTKDAHGTSLIQWCSYYGDVSAIKYLLANGESIGSLGKDLGLNGACFHGHWQLVKFLVESGAKVNGADRETGETPLHSALSQRERLRHNQVVKVLLAAGANPNKATKKNKPTGAFMRDCRTKSETPLHRAAAFGDEQVVQMLIDAGAKVDVVDMNGESPLSWGSWYGRPDSLLRKLLYGPHHIRPDRASMEAYLVGAPKVEEPTKPKRGR